MFFFGAMSLPKGEEFDALLDFANIEYRHLKWLAKEIVKSGGDFDWDRERLTLGYRDSLALYQELLERLQSLQESYKEGALFERIREDEGYIAAKLQRFQAQEPIAITAFSKELRYEGLDQKSLNALVQFLFEEIYKEYELIITYTYSQIHTDSARLALIFEDLIYESLYHLKSFCVLAAHLGILAVPRVVMREVYMFDDLQKFLQEGIEEELAAKEQCRALSSAIEDEELSRFFDFINHQEDYHITLMQEALESISGKLT